MKVENEQMRTRIFLYEFVWSEALIKHIIELCNEKGIEICGWAVRRKDISRLRGVWPDAPIFEAPMPSNPMVINYQSNLLYGFTFEEEENIRFLLDREGTYQNNMHSSQVRYEIYAWVRSILQRTKPDWLLFPDVPHNIFTYLLYLKGKRNGIRSQMIRLGLAPHLFTLSETIERDFFQDRIQTASTDISSQTTEYLKALRFGDEPAYMLKQRRNSKLLQIMKRSLAKGFDLFTKKSMGAVIVYIKRWHLKRFYERLCEPGLDMTKENPYIVVFLHLQPERTTVPEGGIFAQQWLMVQMLSTVCAAEGWNLYVKEHPSTFMIGPKLYRGKWYYSSLKMLPNVSLVSTSVSSTRILENAKAVATITGTVGMEAVAKGIPALLFGESPFIGCAGTYRIKCQADIQEAILSVKDGVEIQFDEVKRFFSAWEHDENCHNTELPRTADHSSMWARGVPQTAMFSKMIRVIEKERLTSLNNVRTF